MSGSSNPLIIEVVNLDGYKGLKSEVVYVGRGSALGNPFSHKTSKYETIQVSSRKEAIGKYEEYILEKIKYRCAENSAIQEYVGRLIKYRRLVLGCYCVPLACHADILAKVILDIAQKEELERDSFLS